MQCKLFDHFVHLSSEEPRFFPLSITSESGFQEMYQLRLQTGECINKCAPNCLEYFKFSSTLSILLSFYDSLNTLYFRSSKGIVGEGWVKGSTGQMNHIDYFS